MIPKPFVAEPSLAADALDRQELAAAATGDRAAFERLYRRYFGRLSRFLRRFNRSPELIEDVVNKTLWVVWSRASDYRGEAKVSTWIMGIAYRTLMKALRDGESISALPARAQTGEQTASSGVDERHVDPLARSDPRPEQELRDWLAKGLQRLPEDLRITLELAYFLGMSCAEIGQVMGCAEGTVKARMFNARLRLRNLMPALGGLDASSAVALRNQQG